MLYKIRKVGNSYGVIIPIKVVEPYLNVGKIDLVVDNKEENLIKEIEPRVIKNEPKVITNVITKKINTINSKGKIKPKTCPKHGGNWLTCGCVWK